MGNGDVRKSSAALSDAAVPEDTQVPKESTRMSGNDPDERSGSAEEDEELLACCVCHCAVDYADREAFFRSDNDDDNQDVLLPAELYDAQNTLVWCHECERPYHQRCHFVPILAPPRNSGWQCLICRSPEYFKKRNQKKLTKQYSAKQHRAGVYPFPPAGLSLVPGDAEKNVKSGKLQRITAQSTAWEADTHSMKAHEWKREFSRLQRALSQQLTNVRLTQMTLQAYTSTRRAQQYLTLQSQELSHALVKLTSSKLKIKQLLNSLDQYRLGQDEKKWITLKDWVEQNPEEENEWFPFGRQHERRIVPRLHGQLETESAHPAAKCSHSQGKNAPPEVVVINQQLSQRRATKTTKSPHAKKALGNGKTSAPKGGQNRSTKAAAALPDDDDDDLISLDDLKCCNCLVGDATDENDLLMCDGAGCFRSFHRLCLFPVPSIEQIEEEEDWFCPICTALTKLIASVQSEFYGDDWEKQAHDDDTIVSWDNVADVFPEAEHEYDMTMKWQAGKEDEETVIFLSSLLGFNASRASHMRHDSDDDEEEDEPGDDDFDLDEFQTRDRDCTDDDGSIASSQATLQDMSSVELNIGRAELNALSSGEDSSDEQSSTEASGQRPRRSRRRIASRAVSTSSTSGDSSSRPDIGTLHESNIVKGKRRRMRVDYRKLNDSMFGDMSETEAAKTLDDQDEFRLRNRKSSSSSSSEQDEDDQSGEESEEDSSSTSSKADPEQSRPNRDNGLNRGHSKSTTQSSARSASNAQQQPRCPTARKANGVKARSNPRNKIGKNASPAVAGRKRAAPRDTPTTRKRRVGRN